MGPLLEWEWLRFCSLSLLPSQFHSSPHPTPATAVNPWHGSATGNTLSRGNALRLHSDHRTRSWAQLGVQLDEALAAPGDPQLAELPLWRDLSSGRHRLWSEHLVYVAAFASGGLGWAGLPCGLWGQPSFLFRAPCTGCLNFIGGNVQLCRGGAQVWAARQLSLLRGLAQECHSLLPHATGAEVVYGDRPKRVTYHRLLWCPSVEDLDAAYGMQVLQRYGTAAILQGHSGVRSRYSCRSSCAVGVAAGFQLVSSQR